MKFTLELQKLMVNDNYLIAIRDNFENLLVKSVLNITDKKIKNEEVDVHVKNRIFSVIVECVQNICKVDKDDPREKDSVLLLNKIENGFQVVAGTIISPERKERLSDLLDDLSNQTLQNLKVKWRGAISDKAELDITKRENLALIDLYLRSQGNVTYFFEDDDKGKHFFMVQIEILND